MIQSESPQAFVHGEMDINQQIALRLSVFLRAELALIPSWHPQFREYQHRLCQLEEVLVVGPQRVRTPI